MKKLFLILGIILACASVANAQNVNANAIKNSVPYCKGLFNPTSFSITPPNLGSASWTGYGGTKQERASVVGNWGATYSSTATAAEMDVNSPSGSSTWIFSGESCDPYSASNDEKKRFKIMNPGLDPLTGNHLNRVPTDPDTTFAHSVRLGNQCGGTGAEKLVYQFKVTPQNAMIVLYYALSLQNGQHTDAANPEFVIEVQVGSPNASTVATNLNTYTYAPVGSKLFFVRPTPAGSGSDVTPFYVGSTGTHNTGAGYACNLYLPWNKVVVNLYEYLNRPVRISIGAGDCSYSAHYAYSYFAGYCRPMSIEANGCPLGNNTYVSTLYAPSGITDPTYTTDPNYHAYKWYICNDTNLLAENIESADLDDNTWFATNFTQLPNEYNDSLNVTADNFLYNGRTLLTRTFVCEMTTYMNQSMTGNVRTYPIRSRLTATVTNKKPQVNFSYETYCDGSVKFINASTCRESGFMTDSLTRWAVYNSNPTFGHQAPIATGVGQNFTYHTDTISTFFVKAEVPTTDSTCYAEKSSVAITSIMIPEASLVSNNYMPCLGDEVILTDQTNYHSASGNSVTWYIDDTVINAQNSVHYSFTVSPDTVRIITTNSYNEPVGNNTNQTRQCADTAFAVINVFTSPELLVSDDTIVCEGKRTHVSVQVQDNDPTAQYDYAWFRRIDGNQIQEGNILEQVPDAGSETSKYYVRVTRQPQGCVAWDSVTVHVVRPTLAMLPADGKICPGETAKLIAGEAHHYSWSASPMDNSLAGQEDKDTIIVRPDQTTVYTMIGHGSDNCDADPLTKTVTIIPTPIPTIYYNPDFVDSEEPMVTFRDDSPNGVSTFWNFGDGSTSNERQSTHAFADLSMDSVHVSMRSFNRLGDRAPGCYADAQVALPVQLFAVWAPNAFTPMLPNNNTFRLVTANEVDNFRIYIYDRHGMLVFQSDDLHFEWDGTYNGSYCQQGAYVYIMSYRRPGTTKVVTRKGTITLIR